MQTVAAELSKQDEQKEAAAEWILLLHVGHPARAAREGEKCAYAQHVGHSRAEVGHHV